MVVDRPGDLGAEPVAGVVGDPALVLVVAGQDADGDGPPGPFDDPGGGAGVGKAAGLERDLGLRGQEAGELVPVLAGSQVREHLVAGRRADDLLAIDGLAEPDHLVGRRASQAELLAPLGKDRRIAAKHLRVDLGVGIAHLLHGRGGRADADRIEHEVGGRIVREGDHQADRVAELERRSVREVVGQDPRARHLVLLS